MAISMGAALLGSAVIGTAGSLKAASSAKKAAKTATDAQFRMYQQTREDQAPWREAGVAALGQLQEFTKPGANLTALLEAQPGYIARRDEGMGMITRNHALRGALNSGGTLKALNRFGQDHASNEYTNIFNRYASLANVGQTANQQIQAANSQYVNALGENAWGKANATASAYNNIAGIWSNTLGQFAGGPSGGGGGSAPGAPFPAYPGTKRLGVATLPVTGPGGDSAGYPIGGGWGTPGGGWGSSISGSSLSFNPEF